MTGFGSDPGHHAEIPIPAPYLPQPHRPHASASSPGAPRWFGPAVAGAAVVALAGALLLSRSEGAERDADVNEDVADFATEACTP